MQGGRDCRGEEVIPFRIKLWLWLLPLDLLNDLRKWVMCGVLEHEWHLVEVHYRHGGEGTDVVCGRCYTSLPKKLRQGSMRNESRSDM